MAIDRRELLASLAAAVAAAVIPARAQTQSRELYLSCRSDGSGHCSAAIFSSDGEELFATNLPARGHDATPRPFSNEIVVFARRPGNWAVVIDPRTAGIRHTILARPDRHFYGHGAFSAGGRLLYATENDVTSGAGLIGIYDATDGYRHVGELGSRGIGPHDLKLLPDGRTLAVANGGLRTLPESGREVLNREDMRPNLALVDPGRDETLGVLEFAADHRALSIRHMAVAPDATVLFGCQYEGDPADLPPLVGAADGSGRIGLFDMPELDLAAMANYVGSVALDRSGRIVAATSPRGGAVALWDRLSGTYLGRQSLSDVCGVAEADGDRRFLLTSGNAGVRTLDPASPEPAPIAGARLQTWVWDNHLRRLTPTLIRAVRRHGPRSG